jgi:hypothetical protein
MADRMLEMAWAKAAWKEACNRCHTQFAYDAKIIKMVSQSICRFLDIDILL